MFDLNILMHIESERDFPELRKQYQVWRKRFPMFPEDVIQLERIIESHIQNFSVAGIHFRQTKQRRYLEQAQAEIDAINRVLETVSKLELMAMLSR